MATQVLITVPGRSSLIAYSVRTLAHTSQNLSVTRLHWKEASCFVATISAFEVKKPCRRCASCASEGSVRAAVWTNLFTLSHTHQRIVKKVLILKELHTTKTVPVSKIFGFRMLMLVKFKDTSVTTSRWQDAHVVLYFAQTQGRAVSLCLHYLQGYQSVCWGDLSAAHHQSQAPLPVPLEWRVEPLWSFDRPLIPLHLPRLGTSAQPGNSREGILRKSLPPNSRAASSSQSQTGTAEERRCTTDKRCET